MVSKKWVLTTIETTYPQVLHGFVYGIIIIHMLQEAARNNPFIPLAFHILRGDSVKPEVTSISRRLNKLETLGQRRDAGETDTHRRGVRRAIMVRTC